MPTEPVPIALAEETESYISDRFEEVARRDDADFLDDNGVFRLHELVATAYARGFTDGAMAERVRNNGVRRRERDAARREEIRDA